MVTLAPSLRPLEIAMLPPNDMASDSWSPHDRVLGIAGVPAMLGKCRARNSPTSLTAVSEVLVGRC
jgi:hypothetical protein